MKGLRWALPSPIIAPVTTISLFTPFCFIFSMMVEVITAQNTSLKGGRGPIVIITASVPAMAFSICAGSSREPWISCRFICSVSRERSLRTYAFTRQLCLSACLITFLPVNPDAPKGGRVRHGECGVPGMPCVFRRIIPLTFCWSYGVPGAANNTGGGARSFFSLPRLRGEGKKEITSP